MYYYHAYHSCCESTQSDCGDATESKQDLILAAIADLQTTADAVEECVEETKASVKKPEIC